MRVVSMRDLSDSGGDEPGFFAHAATFASPSLAELHDFRLVLGEIRQNLADEIVRRRDATRESDRARTLR